MRNENDPANWNGMIFNEDCFETFKKMPKFSVTHVFTSPPYNRKRNDKYTHYDDQIVDYYTFLVNLAEQAMYVAKWFANKFFKEAEVVYDPFMGTGTTALACMSVGAKWFGSELSSEYVEMAKERIEESKKSRLHINQ
jgi:DNA modification methylase